MGGANGHASGKTMLYARVSTDEQARSGYSLAQQIEALRAYAARECYEVQEEVTDAGQSGAKPREAQHGPREGSGCRWEHLHGAGTR